MCLKSISVDFCERKRIKMTGRPFDCSPSLARGITGVRYDYFHGALTVRLSLIGSSAHLVNLW